VENEKIKPEKDEAPQLQTLREKLAAKRERLASQLGTVTKNLEAVNLALHLLTEPKDHGAIKRSKKSEDLHVSIDELRNLTVAAGLFLIARRNDGIVKIRPTRELMEKAEKISPGQKGSNALWTVIDRSGSFERIQRGQYRLIGDAGGHNNSDRPNNPVVEFSMERNTIIR